VSAGHPDSAPLSGPPRGEALGPCPWRKDPRDDRTVGVGRDLWRSPCPRCLLKHVHREHISQDPVRKAFEGLQGWRVHKLSRQPVVDKEQCFTLP